MGREETDAVKQG